MSERSRRRVAERLASHRQPPDGSPPPVTPPASRRRTVPDACAVCDRLAGGTCPRFVAGCCGAGQIENPEIPCPAGRLPMPLVARRPPTPP
ncbi:MAG TPA: hypothetical protein VMW52_00040 [Phycisphaerae bacterium]|nr:hypothetical protein [Phycisphaerae bacterium]